MKYSFMTFSCPELPLDEVLAVAKRYSYDAVEPRAEADHRHGIELGASIRRRQAIRRTVAQSGLSLSCIATSCQLANPAQAAEAVERACAYVELASDVGCGRVRVFGGALPPHTTRQQASDTLVASLRSVAAAAAEREVIVCLETHDHWCDPADVVAVMKDVNKASIGVNWDIMHPLLRAGVDIEGAYSALRAWIRHVHFHDGQRENDETVLMPIGQGAVDHRSAVHVLSSGGYEGYLSGEWIDWSIPYDTHLSRELDTMRRYEREEALGDAR